MSTVRDYQPSLGWQIHSSSVSEQCVKIQQSDSLASTVLESPEGVHSQKAATFGRCDKSIIFTETSHTWQGAIVPQALQSFEMVDYERAE